MLKKDNEKKEALRKAQQAALLRNKLAQEQIKDHEHKEVKSKVKSMLTDDKKEEIEEVQKYLDDLIGNMV
jgi:hypothetical protein